MHAGPPEVLEGALGSPREVEGRGVEDLMRGALRVETAYRAEIEEGGSRRVHPGIVRV